MRAKAIFIPSRVGLIMVSLFFLSLVFLPCQSVGAVVIDTNPPRVNILSYVHASYTDDKFYLDIYDIGGSGVAGAKLYNDGAYVMDIDSPYDLAIYDTSALADGTYQIEVVATDVAGNIATSSPYAMVIDHNPPPPPPDTTAPRVTLLSVVNNKVYTDIYDVGGSGVASVLLFIDNVLNQTVIAPAAYDLIIADAGSLAEGIHEVVVSAIDVAGNQATSSVSQMDVDKTAPAVSLDPLDDYLSSLDSITGTTTDNGSGVAGVTVKIKDLENNSYWNGEGWQEGEANLAGSLGEGDFSYDSSAVIFTNGHLYEVTALATDDWENSASVSDSFTFDNEAPTTTDDVPAGTQTASVTITFTCTDELSGCAKVLYTTDGSNPSVESAFTNVSSGWEISVSGSGNYIVKYRGIDAVGNLEDIRTATNTLVISTGGGGGGGYWWQNLPSSSTDANSTSTVVTGTSSVMVLVETSTTTSSTAPIITQVLGVKIYNFQNNLGFGSRGDTVKQLQLFLIAQNAGPAARALAKVGATGYFGRLTRTALAEYQRVNNIRPAYGYFGPITRKYINGL